MYNVEHSFMIPDAATSASFSISGTSAQSPVIVPADSGRVGVPCVIQTTADCFVRRGINPVALADGTDLAIPAGTMFRTTLAAGERVAVITSGAAGTFRITPGA